MILEFVETVLHDSLFPSYLKIFDLNYDRINLIYNKRSCNSEECASALSTVEPSLSDEAELTGNPLEVDLFQEDTLISYSMPHILPPSWDLLDKSRYPLKLKDARVALRRKIHSVQEPPTFVLCDGKDTHKIIILGINNQDLNSFDIMIQGILLHSDIESSLKDMVKDHMKSVINAGTTLSTTAHIKNIVKAKYNLFGTSIKQIVSHHSPLNKSSAEKCCYISLEGTAHECVFHITNSSKFQLKLHVEVVTGHTSLKYYELWDELNMLGKCIYTLSNKEFIGSGNTMICHLHIVEPLEEFDIFNEIETLLETPLQIRNRRETIHNKEKFFRSLWDILKRCSNLSTLVNAWHHFFEKFSVLSSNSDISINNELFNMSFLMKEISKNKMILSVITHTQALELLFEIGVYKLKWDLEDALSVFSSTAKANINEMWRSIFEEQKNLPMNRTQIAKLTDKIYVSPITTKNRQLSYLEQLYKGIEFINIAKEKIMLSTIGFSKFCNYIEKEYISVILMKQILDSPFFELTLEFDTEENDAALITNILPFSWTMFMTSLSSSSARITTAYNLSDSPIFPNIEYDSPTETNQKSYFVSKMVRIQHSACGKNPQHFF